MRKAALQAAEQRGILETRARAYLADTFVTKPWPELRLTAVEVSRPTTEWVRREVAGRHPVEAHTVLGGMPAVSLEFAIAGDRNVVDVILINGTPVASDYH